MAMRLLDLFSGIGGFSYAAEKLIGGYETVAFCEMDEFCQKVLKKHWPQVPIFNDVRTIDATRLGRIDIVTGGYPCQPFSQAGRRQGEEDERHLWPEMLRIIKSCQPRYVLAENVAGHVTMGLDQVLTDLEDQGYTTRPIIVPACAKNAPHRRDRVWIIGQNVDDSNDSSDRAKRGKTRKEDSLQKEYRQTGFSWFSDRTSDDSEPLANTDKWQSRSGDESKSDETQQLKFSTDSTSERGIVANTTSKGKWEITRGLGESQKEMGEKRSEFTTGSDTSSTETGTNVANSKIKQSNESTNDTRVSKQKQGEFRGSGCRENVADSKSKGLAQSNEREICISKQSGMDSNEKRNRSKVRSKSTRRNKLSTENVTNTDNEGLQRHGQHRQVEREHGQRQSTEKNIPHGKEKVLANTSSIGQSRSRKSVEPISTEENKIRKTSGSDDGSQRGKHDGNIEQRVGNMADGLSRGLLRHFDREPEHIPRVTKGEKDRAKKLKALGNSIVPQVAAEILLAIRVSEGEENGSN